MPVGSSLKASGRILLVDDEPAVVTYLSTMLCKLRYEVTSAAEPKEALAHVRRTPGGFDLLVTDQTMPTMTGLQLAAAVRKLGEDMPVIVMTGYSEDLTSERIAQIGIHAVLAKPFTASELEQVIRTAMN